MERREDSDFDEGGAWYDGTMIKGSNKFEVNEVMANISMANVPTRVAFCQASSICSGVRSGFSAK